MIPDAGDAVANGRVRQVEAGQKRLSPDADDAVGNGYAFQAVRHADTEVKRPIHDVGDRIAVVVRGNDNVTVSAPSRHISSVAVNPVVDLRRGRHRRQQTGQGEKAWSSRLEPPNRSLFVGTHWSSIWF